MWQLHDHMNSCHQDCCQKVWHNLQKVWRRFWIQKTSASLGSSQFAWDVATLLCLTTYKWIHGNVNIDAQALGISGAIACLPAPGTLLPEDQSCVTSHHCKSVMFIHKLLVGEFDDMNIWIWCCSGLLKVGFLRWNDLKTIWKPSGWIMLEWLQIWRNWIVFPPILL